MAVVPTWQLSGPLRRDRSRGSLWFLRPRCCGALVREEQGELTVIAAAQSVAVDGDIDANIRQHAELLRRAVDNGAELVVFPELSLTGYLIAQAPLLALELTDPRLDELRAIATDHGLIAVVGAPVRRDGRLVLGSLVLSSSGVSVYAKQHLGAFSEGAAVDGVLPAHEGSVFTAGTSDLLLDVSREGGLAACAICADTGHPEHAARAAAKGARYYLASVFAIPSAYDAESVRFERAHAEHGLTVLVANHGGPTGGLRAAGRTAFLGRDQAGSFSRHELPAEGQGLLLARRSGAGWRVSDEVSGRGRRRCAGSAGTG